MVLKANVRALLNELALLLVRKSQVVFLFCFVCYGLGFFLRFPPPRAPPSACDVAAQSDQIGFLVEIVPSFSLGLHPGYEGKMQ